MRAGSAITSSGRHVGGMALQAALIVAILAALVFAAAMVTGNGPGGAKSVFAGRGAGETYSTISLDAGATARTQLARGSDVRFATKVVGLKGGEYPMVYLECYSHSTGKLLYGQLDHPDATFVLGGGSSDWWLIEPSPAATCYAHLYSYGGRSRGHDVIRELTDPSQPVLDFAAAGS